MNNNHNNTNNHRPSVSLSDLNSALQTTADHFKGINKNFKKLKKINDTLVDFNEAFSAFLFGMAANDTTIEWTNGPKDDTIERHKEHIKRINTLEATKAVNMQTNTLPSNHTTVSTKTSQSTRTPPPSRKKRKLAQDKPEKPIISNRRFVNKINIKQIVDHLPIKYRERTDARNQMETLLKTLRLHPSGLTTKELVKESKLAQYVVADCIGALTHAKEIIKISEMNQYSKFLLDPSKYPSQENH